MSNRVKGSDTVDAVALAISAADDHEEQPCIGERQRRMARSAISTLQTRKAEEYDYLFEEHDRQSALIAQLTEALKIAKPYITTGIMTPKVMADQEKIRTALAAAKEQKS